MQALELLRTRSSMPRLIEPGPTTAQLDVLLEAAARAPDHMTLTPYKIMVFQGDGRLKLGEIMQEAAAAKNMPEAKVTRASQLPLRAPMVIVVAMEYEPHDSVPRNEQLSCSACVALLMQQAAFAQGLGAIWRTGWFAEDELVKERLGLRKEDAIVSMLYVGTPAVPTPIKPAKDIAENVEVIS